MTVVAEEGLYQDGHGHAGDNREEAIAGHEVDGALKTVARRALNAVRAEAACRT